jgi:hypothetical protein
MPHPFVGLLFTGFIARTIIAVVVIVAVLWLALKLGRLVDAYTEKLRAK